MSAVSRRKLEHLDLCAREDVEARRTTLLEEVELVHEALPELSAAEIDLGASVLGRSLRAPILITGMTGGAERAREINRALASAAQKYGLALGLGSQRAMWLDPELASTYRVRDVAPDILLLANLGVVQARDAGPAAAAELVDAVHADALCIHLNPAQELAQDEGDRDFRGCAAAIEALVAALPVPVIVKETGCGLSRRTLARLRGAGVRWVDVAGAGGTSWPGVESLRGSTRQRALGAALREWGIPTAASLCFAREAGFDVVASGGLRDAGDVIRALALGARLGGMALPWLRAHERGGLTGVLAFAEELTESLRALMLLVGARRVDELARVPRVLGLRLRAWIGETAGASAAVASR
ncbi:MAG TPA: type 2 isopentenyl-diphosphate Delta-isomerase [Myxococcota bacterium]|nr:type 2 isopentenyl-diphosphate Delta-isomerase [Myxococcota bacterium]